MKKGMLRVRNVCVLVLLISGDAFADETMPAAIHSLFQIDEDVEIVLGIDEYSLDLSYKLTFGDGYEQKILFEDRGFDQSENIGDYEYCHSGSEFIETCREDPERDCIDCDGDGVAECPYVRCDHRYLFSTIHPCAPSGLITYIVHYHSDKHGYYDSGHAEIQVVKPFGSCTADEYEIDEDWMPGHGEGGANCSASTNHPAPASGTFFLMLLIGLIF